MRTGLLRTLFFALVIAAIGCGDDDDAGGDGGNGDGDGNSGSESVVEVDSVSPDHGPLPGDTVITITGSGFLSDRAPPNKVLVGGVETDLVEVIDDTTAKTKTPPGGIPGAVDVVVYNSNGFGIAEGAFTYNALPTITAVDPDHGDRAGGDTITLTGTGLQALEAGTNVVYFGENQGTSVTVTSDTTLTVDSPPGVPFTIVDVSLGNANGQAMLPQSYEYITDDARLIALGRGLNDGSCGCGGCEKAGKPAMQAEYPGEGEAWTPYAFPETIEVEAVTQLYEIDPGTGTVSSIGEAFPGLTGLAQAQNGTMYGVTAARWSPSRVLVTVDLATGEITEVGPLGSSHNINDITIIGVNLVGVAWRDVAGEQFGSINTISGAYTPLGGTELNTGPGGGNGLAYDGSTLYLAKGASLCEMHASTGALSNCISMLARVPGMTVANGELYGAVDNYAMVTSTIERIDKATGTMAEIAVVPARVTALGTAE